MNDRYRVQLCTKKTGYGLDFAHGPIVISDSTSLLYPQCNVSLLLAACDSCDIPHLVLEALYFTPRAVEQCVRVTERHRPSADDHCGHDEGEREMKLHVDGPMRISFLRLS